MYYVLCIVQIEYFLIRSELIERASSLYSKTEQKGKMSFVVV